MANLATRRATFDSAITTLRQLLIDTRADISGNDSEKGDIQKLRDRVNAGIAAMGLPVNASHL